MKVEDFNYHLPEELIAKRESWILPLWGIFAAIMLFLIAQGVPVSYDYRYNDAVTLFPEQLDALGLSAGAVLLS